MNTISRAVVYVNVRTQNISKYPNGSLDYDMSFKKNYTELIIDDWYNKINKGEYYGIYICSNISYGR